jgi:hypothetical protein
MLKIVRWTCPPPLPLIGHACNLFNENWNTTVSIWRWKKNQAASQWNPLILILSIDLTSWHSLSNYRQFCLQVFVSTFFVSQNPFPRGYRFSFVVILREQESEIGWFLSADKRNWKNSICVAFLIENKGVSSEFVISLQLCMRCARSECVFVFLQGKAIMCGLNWQILLQESGVSNEFPLFPQISYFCCYFVRFCCRSQVTYCKISQK